MSKKKRTLPESLELLLDTMCNTFGGIMFIAIALIIISQLVSKAQLSMTDEQINEAAMEKIKENIKTLHQEILKLQQEKLEATFQVKDASPEKQEIIKQLAEQGKKNLALIQDIENTKNLIVAARIQLDRMKNEYEGLKKLLDKKKIAAEENKQKNKELKEKLEKEIVALEEELKKIQPRHLRFAKEENTSLLPYWILLQNNVVYRFFTSGNNTDVKINDYGKKVIVTPIPGKGTALGENPDEELKYLFGNVDRTQTFVSLVTDYDSFEALFTIREYLRMKKIKSYWNVDPQYIFHRVDHVQHKASD